MGFVIVWHVFVLWQDDIVSVGVSVCLFVIMLCVMVLVCHCQ